MNKKLAYTVVLIGLLAAPTFLYPVFVMKVLCFAMFAAAFNLLLGYTGLLSFGHAAFFGGAGYITGYLIKEMNVNFEVAVLAGVAASAMLGLVIGFLAIRRQGIYFTMITLSLAQLVYFVCLQLPHTGGEDGLQGISRQSLFGVIDLANDNVLYYVVLAIFVGVFGLILRIIHSPYGQVLKAIKENEPRAISLGYDVVKYKLLAFVLSASIAGLAGATKAILLGFETLSDVHWSMSGMAVLMTLVGGLGTIVGPLVGAIVIIVLENKLGDIGMALAELTGVSWFHTLGESVTIVTGLIFIVCVMTFRQGIVGEILALSKRKGTGMREKGVTGGTAPATQT